MFIHLAVVAITSGELTCWTVGGFSCDGRPEGVLISHGSLLICIRGEIRAEHSNAVVIRV